MWVYIEPEGDEAIWKRKHAAGKGETRSGNYNEHSGAEKRINDLIGNYHILRGCWIRKGWNTRKYVILRQVQVSKNAIKADFLWKLHNGRLFFASKFVQIAQKRFSCPTSQKFCTFGLCNRYTKKLPFSLEKFVKTVQSNLGRWG